MRISDWSSDVCSSDLSGSSETVRFADAVVGGTDYKGDLIVTGSGFATGVALSGATDAVSVDFAGAALSVTSTGANATGITTQDGTDRSEEHTSEHQSLMRISYAVFCLKTRRQANSRQHRTRTEDHTNQ